MAQEKVKLGEGGRIVIPAEFRKALGIQVGEELILQLEHGTLKLYTRKQAIESIREQIADYLPKERSLADELIAERREEAGREP